VEKIAGNAFRIQTDRFYTQGGFVCSWCRKPQPDGSTIAFPPYAGFSWDSLEVLEIKGYGDRIRGGGVCMKCVNRKLKPSWWERLFGD
jgi:hypothetical protein